MPPFFPKTLKPSFQYYSPAISFKEKVDNMSQPNNNDDNNNKYKKIFVGGLAWAVTTDVLRNFFQEHYGEVVEANVVSETLSDGNLKSKGYGFVTFRDAESASIACQHPPIIEGRQTDVNLAYLRARNNPNHSNQTGLLQEAGPSHQYQHGPFNQMAWHPYQNGPFNQAWSPYQNGWFNQVAWHQYPQFYTKPHFPQAYWGSSYYGAYRHMYNVPHYSCSSTVNGHHNSVRPAGRGPILKELSDTNQEAVKDQGEINGQDEQEKTVSGEDDDTKQGAGVTNQLCEENSEIEPQENGLDHEEKPLHEER